MTINESKGQILIVSPDRKVYEQMTRVLQASGYAIEYARTLAKGLKEAGRGHYEVIILDWLFEDGTGVDLCEAIRETDQETPIFFYTGATSSADLKAGLRAGAQGCFVKPGEVEDS